jgi:hypothetical protein
MDPIVDESQHFLKFGHLFPLGVSRAQDCCNGVCIECGNDDQCEGYRYCSDCMEELGHDVIE